MNERVIIGLLAAGVGAYFLLRPQQAYAAAPLDVGPGAYGPPLPPSYNANGGKPMPRGIRNHNPMNLRYYESINWQGQIGPDDAGYARFENVEKGIRAGVKNLVNGYFNRGLDSPYNIITKYAPHVENPTDNYIRFVAEKLGIDKTTSIPLNHDNMMKLTKAIIEFENGSNPYLDSTVNRGVIAGMTT